MTYAKVSSEPGLVLDAVRGVLGEEREDLVFYPLSDVEQSVKKLEEIADDLVNSLDPLKNFKASYQGREKSLYYAGMTTGIFYGLIVGLLIAFLIAWVM
ncbi:MAG: tetrahydromethanopterin S-methyltransferase subunit B [Archaeoglobales archaeon]|jgi:tetrahydromethanopterin S-methyltransferase subunit B|nr:tetrahydromethanopterin S-methyltransferase subunit B [Archaeoglobales archaeon]TDA27161.1 MAG: tetrahydromethanopterin S-methyltransferase subunit B [Archaeoglobi archaeon]TDA28114.1 MAG: tetrahydromethanopterin S-methyltransferase subunit B [Archaeoglobi archaeon]TDA30828.1 MAG: tetrahydromethanopterin S-methyltransferase subunit B [Archaeoglobi archaeon]